MAVKAEAGGTTQQGGEGKMISLPLSRPSLHLGIKKWETHYPAPTPNVPIPSAFIYHRFGELVRGCGKERC